MAKVERSVITNLIIQRMCQELRMTEEQLLAHLAVESVEKWLSPAQQEQVMNRAALYHQRGVFVIEVEK